MIHEAHDCSVCMYVRLQYDAQNGSTTHAQLANVINKDGQSRNGGRCGAPH